jgi:hypothetical protein
MTNSNLRAVEIFNSFERDEKVAFLMRLAEGMVVAHRNVATQATADIKKIKGINELIGILLGMSRVLLNNRTLTGESVFEMLSGFAQLHGCAKDWEETLRLTLPEDGKGGAGLAS